jgi:hypothetical protein
MRVNDSRSSKKASIFSFSEVFSATTLDVKNDARQKIEKSENFEIIFKKFII